MGHNLVALPMQALVVGAAHMLQMPTAAAVSSVGEAVAGRVCSLLVDAATCDPEVTAHTAAYMTVRMTTCQQFYGLQSTCDFVHLMTQDSDTLARQARLSAKHLQQVLATFPPAFASADMERLQQQVDYHRKLTPQWRSAFAGLYARCDSQLSTTRILFAILKLDNVD